MDFFFVRKLTFDPVINLDAMNKRKGSDASQTSPAAASGAAKDESTRKTSTVIVQNLPLDATKEEVEFFSCFSAFYLAPEFWLARLDFS